MASSGLPPSLQAVQLWPIKAQGAIIRHNPLGDPSVEQNYHQALEDGRWLEQNVADANHWLLQKQQLIKAKIQTYLAINKLAVDGQLGHHPRRFKYIADSIIFLQEVSQFQQDVLAVIQALQQNISLLASMERNVLGLVQSTLNSLALLLNGVCNWGLPSIPSIPSLLPDGMFNWNGFNFSPLASFASLAPNANFNTNFSFAMCMLGLPNSGSFSASPASVMTYSGLPLGTPLYVPPLGGSSSGNQDLTDPNYIAQMQITMTPPVYGPTFNPNTSMFGSVPDPSTIISNYQMPAQTYQNNIVSIVPSLRGNVVEPSDPDYSNPNYTVRQPALQKDLAHYITLDAVVNSNYDPYVTSAWLFYLNLDRNGRQGTWLIQYEDVYMALIQPSVTSLASSPVPWNNVLGGTGVSDTPTDIPLVDVLKALPTAELQQTLWLLSYIEASLLGYTRSKTWDAYQNANYLSGVTGADLDYVPTTVNPSVTSTITLGEGTAEYPTPCTFPTAITAVLNEVIAFATVNIAADLTYSSPRLSNRFVYNQFAQATMVDRFTQFWRDFNTNVVSFLAQDPYLVQFAVTYVGTLNGALNPLGNQTAYMALQTDAATRNRAWTPGTPLLVIPVAPVVTYTNTTPPTSGGSGWSGINFDPVAFLSRPDIQGQPIPVQIAMLRTNLSYAGLMQYQNQATSAIQNQISNATAMIANAQQLGFLVQDNTDMTVVPSGSSGVPVAFDTTVFDLTGNVMNSTIFTVKSAGEYTYYGSLSWEGTDTGQIRTVMVTQNGMPILMQSADPSFTAPVILSFSGYGNFAQGDVVQVLASHSFATSETVGPGSYFSMVQSGPAVPPPQVPSSAIDDFTVFTADVNMPTAPTAIFVQPDGNVAPIDPTIIQGHLQAVITNVSVVGTTLTVTCDNDFSPGAMAFFYGLTNATFLNGQSVVITTVSSTQFTTVSSTQFTATVGYPPFTEPGSPPVETGVANSGTVLFPFVDGVTLTSATAGNPINCATYYGGQFQVQAPGSPAGFIPGGLLYVGPGGVLTQDYATLITEVQWVICVARAVTDDTFIYEPHLPLMLANLL